MTHPAVEGRETELRALTDAVRRLTVATVTHVASAEDTAAMAAAVNTLAERLEVHVPDPVPPRHVMRPGGSPTDGHPYDFVLGRYNPLALPVRLELDPPKARGLARFTTPYEGPPGCVHGAVIAGVFDMVMAAANQAGDVGGVTARLTVRFRRPTRLHHDLVFEAWPASTHGRRTTTEGRIVQDGEVTVEAEGLFIAVDPATLVGMGRTS